MISRVLIDNPTCDLVSLIYETHRPAFLTVFFALLFYYSFFLGAFLLHSVMPQREILPLALME